MADEEVIGATSPAPSDHKRKLEDLEPDAPEPPSLSHDAVVNGDASDDSDAKRPRSDDNPDGLVDKENGHEERSDELKEEVTDKSAVVSNSETDYTEQQGDEAQETVNKEAPIADDNQTEAPHDPPADNTESENAEASANNGSLMADITRKQLEDGMNCNIQKGLTVVVWIDTNSVEVPDNNFAVFFKKVRNIVVNTLHLSEPKLKVYYESNKFGVGATTAIKGLEKLHGAKFKNCANGTVSKSMLLDMAMWGLKHYKPENKNPVYFVVTLDRGFDYLFQQLVNRRFRVIICDPWMKKEGRDVKEEGRVVPGKWAYREY